MKTLIQYIYENNFHKSEINEKLIINKNFKAVTANNAIYDRFKKTLKQMTQSNMWNAYDNLNDIGSLSSDMRKNLNDVIRPLIPKNNDILVHYVTDGFGRSIFETMLYDINKNRSNMDFLYEDSIYEYETSGKKYKLIAKVFETDKHVIGIVGPEDESYSSPSNNVIIFAYK